jgi:DNA-directed RNA polymerase specialized sigma24 family protein
MNVIFIEKTRIKVEDNRLFINYINDHYKQLYYKYRQFCKEKDYEWSEDIFQDTIVNCYSAITKKGNLQDTSNQGIENYFFKSFKMNLMREKQYARNQKRDLNVEADDVDVMYEEWTNNNKEDARTKIVSDMWKDFSCLYIMMLVEEQFDDEHFYLFRLKHLCNMTYKQLTDKTGIKGVRQKILDVKQWLKDNLKKEEINKAFQLAYGDLL